MAGLADAATDRVSINQAPALGTWSVCAWVKPTASASFSPIVRVEAGGGTAMVFGMKSLAPSLYSAASATGINGTAQTLNQYVFVGATRNGTAAALYWGTNPASLSKVTGTVNSSGTPDTWTVFGRSPSDGSEWFAGVVDYLRTWAATVLTDAEMAAEAAATAPVKAGAWGVWPFGDNGSGGVSLNDTSGNARHLVAGSTPLSLVADVSLTPTITGTGAAVAPAVAVAGTGAVTVSGTGTTTAPSVVAAGTSAVRVAGSGAANAPPAAAAGTGGAVVTGSGAALAPPVAASGQGSAVVAGQGAPTAPPTTAAGTGAVVVAGTGAATAPPVVAAGTGTLGTTITGSGAAVAPPVVASGAGRVVITGVGTAMAPPVVAHGFDRTVVPAVRPKVTIRPNLARLAAAANPATASCTPNRALLTITEEA
ncbi:LamG-like jellyroll fold domain-containing protein [Amycolatopsis sp. NPDC049688]|uniref:LamG-like jellyroll fold domain-containing protein n=1 Tax=Amycolatopsis sp. NPDC049688 TaxID=3154733 RepID=UPI00343EE790